MESQHTQTSLSLELQSQHRRTHKGLKASKCEQCNKEFSSKTYLKLHIKSVHEGKKEFQCDICSQRLTSPTHLKYHKR